MRSLMHLLKKQPRLWWMVLQALVWSGWYRWHILKRPFAELSEKLGCFQEETPVEVLDEKVIREVQFAVTGVCNHTPWESKCLVQALTAKKLLNQRGLPCTLYMGVGKDEKQNMIAHAWLRCGNIFVTGGNGFPHYAVTGTYAG